MPRLVGKQSNDGLRVSLVMLTAIAIAAGLEYVGIIDLVPGFGKDNVTLSVARYGISSDQVIVSESVQK
ncbi:MAG: hypothetical protein HC781_00400 [Leptolyngbyaceae cyanobacterium CSU_1_4]|nr:hypothetical protein [Leptolyngbyaceae cyanobacterium CSU_1_4]